MAVLQNYRDLDADTKFAAWTQAVLKHKLADYFRSKEFQRRVFLPVPDSGDLCGDVDPTPGLKERLLECLQKVNSAYPKHARVLVLRYQGFGFDDICERLRLSRVNAYTLLSRARSMLERCLDKGDIR